MDFKHAFEYIKGMKHALVVALSIFLAAAILGLLFAIRSPEQTALFIHELRGSLGYLANLSPFNLALAIFLNNAVKSAAMVLLGGVFGLFPALSLIGNGYLVGLVGFSASTQEGWLIFFGSIIPHGIIELPLIILSGALGLRLGYVVLQKIRKRTDQSVFLEYKNASIILFKIVIPLLFISALIEAFVTPLLVSVVG